MSGCGGPDKQLVRELSIPYDRNGAARSLATSPLQVLPETGPLPWYLARNDEPVAVDSLFADYRMSETSSVTYTRDSLRTYDGRVRSDYDRTVYRRDFDGWY